MKKLLLLAFILSYRPGLAQNKRIDSLKQVLSISKEDTSKVWVLDELSESYTFSFADSAVIYAQQGLQLARQLDFKTGEAWCMTDLGAALTTLGNYSMALNWNFKSLSLFKMIKDRQGVAYVDVNLGICYRDQGDYKKSLYYLFESKRSHLFDWTDAVIASVYERNDQLDSALFYANKSNNKYPNQSGLLYVLGTIHAKLGHHLAAFNFYKTAIPIAKKDNVQIDILDCCNGISNLYLKEGKKDSALYYAKEAINQQWARTYPIGILHASILLAHIYESLNTIDSTLKYLKLTITLKDSLFNQQKTREAETFAFNEQLHQQELQQKLEQSESNYRNRLKIYILVAGVVILFILAAGLWRKNIYKQRSYALLQKQKQEIDAQKIKVEGTLAELRMTQSQLIQSEKMASLGELTAGIAHEIQNPLNFVNNFSEANKELLIEMNDEIGKGNYNEASSIAKDVIANQEKINFHGKRADAIVKGMLQHSRTSSGQKDFTDINALCDEYLRLAYHGLRARDKSFNVAIKTDFDTSIGKINIVPQDVGRVILNLISNAFYAVNEKAKLRAISYEPIVLVSTKRAGDKIIICIADNGNGIPSKILDKIFQPFFTTKPTGQGTGLGLSLAYDIVKAHSGEIKVETREGEGSEFIIQLPTKSNIQ